MQNKKVYGSIIGAVALVVVALVFVLGFTLGSLNQNQENNLNNTASAIEGQGMSWSDSTDTKYYISTQEDLERFRKEVNSYGKTFAGCTVYLTKDLRISGEWTPIGVSNNEANTFKGIFDGQGFSIISADSTNGFYGTSGVLGLFGYNYGCTIKNLHIRGVNYNGGSYIGGFVAYLSSGTLNISDCSIMIAEEMSGSSNVGGFVGYANGSINISNANVYSTKNIKATNGNAGGLISFAYMTGNSSITNCNVTFPTNSLSATSSVGGLIGECDTSAGTFTFSNIEIAMPSLTPSANYVGGLIGYNNLRNNNATLNFSNININIDNISGANYVGGLIGYQTSGSNSSYLSNFTDITVDFTSISVSKNSSSAYVGGIVGYSNKYSTFTRCKVLKFSTASGGISASISSSINESTSETASITKSLSITGSYAGGIIGYASYGVLMTNCEVNINNGTYGIRSYGSVEVRATQSYGSGYGATATASTTDIYAGGLMGYNGSSGGTATNNISGCVVNLSGLKYGVYAEAYAYAYSKTTSSGRTATSSSTTECYAGGAFGYSSYSNISDTKVQISASSYSVYGNANSNTVTYGNGGSTGYTNQSYGEDNVHTLSGKSYTGGLVGYQRSTANLSNNLVTAGKSTGIYALTTADYSYAGGIVGYLNSTATVSGQKLDNTRVYARTTRNYITTKYTYAGGITGHLNGSGGTISNCFVSGTIQTDATTSYNSTTYNGYEYCGGIAGYNYGLIKDCLNVATINASKDKSTNYAGGIAGYGRRSSSTSYIITRCGNLGSVTGYYAFAMGYYNYATSSFAQCSISAGSTSSSYCGFSSSVTGTNIYQLSGSSTASSNTSYLKNYSKFNSLSYFSNGWTLTDSVNYNGHPTIVTTCNSVGTSSSTATSQITYSYALYNFNMDLSTVTVTANGISFKLVSDESSNVISQGMASLQMNSNTKYVLAKAFDEVDLGYCKIRYQYIGKTLDLLVFDANPSSGTSQKYTISYNYSLFKKTGDTFFVNTSDFNLDYTTNQYTVTYEVQFKGGYFPKFREGQNDWSFIADREGNSLNNGTCIYEYTFVNGLLKMTLWGWYDYENPPTFEMSAYDSSFNQAKNISVTSSTGDIRVQTIYDGINATTFITPTGSQHVHSIIIDNQYEVEIAYYRGTIYQAGGAFNIEYSAKTYDNTLTLDFEKIYREIKIEVNLVTGVENTDLKEPVNASGGASINGVVVKAQIGGEARVVGNDIADSSVGNNEEVTLVAVAYTGYKFVGWMASDGSDIPNADQPTLRVTKENALNKIFVAQFVKIAENGNINGQVNDDFSGIV